MAGASVAGLTAGQSIGLDLMQRPTLLIPIPSTGQSQLLVGGLGILAGAVFREAGTVLTAQQVTGTSLANAAAANNISLAAGGAGVTTWISGFEVTGGGATAGSVITVTLTGLAGGTRNYQLVIPAGAGTSITPLVVEFPPPGLPASAPNQGITLNVPSFGAGNTNAAANINGYTQTVGQPLADDLPMPVVIGDLLDGTNAAGELLAPLDLVPFGLYAQGLGPHGPVFVRGLFLSLTSGNVRGAVYVKI